MNSLKDSKYVIAAAGLLIGVIVGQVSIILAVDFAALLNSAYELASLAYVEGCADAGGLDCTLKSMAYEEKLKGTTE